MRSVISHLLIRADGSTDTGVGHLMRCLALSQTWIARGGEVTIAAKDCPPVIQQRLLEEKVEYRSITCNSIGDETDANETSRIAREKNVQWVILDGYHFDIDYQRKIRAQGLRSLIFDDHYRSNLWHADIILNQNLNADATRYKNEAANGKVIAGSNYTLLRREFRNATNAQPKHDTGRRILITLGGGDPENISGFILEQLNSIATSGLSIKIIVGATNPHLVHIREISRKSPHTVEVLTAVKNMAPMYEWCNAVVSNAGSTCWEWLSYNLPAAITITADNQQFIAKELSANSRAINLGQSRTLDAQKVRAQLADLLACIGDQRHEQKIVDGHGASRVCAALGMPLRVTILTSETGWFKTHSQRFVTALEKMGHEVRITTRKSDIEEGDVLLLLSVWEIIPQHILKKNSHNLIVHESHLPTGRGWSPVSWQVLDGANEIPICLLEADSRVDAGVVYARSTFNLTGTELIQEIRKLQADATIALCLEFIKNFPHSLATAKPQVGVPTYYARRRSECSRIEPTASISDCFNLFRIADNDKYPVFFEYRGKRYKLAITSMGETHE